MTTSWKNKIRLAHIGKPSGALGKRWKYPHLFSMEHRKKLSISRLGKKVSEETKEKLRLARIGKPSPFKGKKHTTETRKRMSEANKGEKCHLWKGGISHHSKKECKTLKYRLWREAVFARDNWTCQDCDKLGSEVYLIAHHIKSWAKYPKLRFKTSNGKTLCENCHSLTDNYKGRAIKSLN